MNQANDYQAIESETWKIRTPSHASEEGKEPLIVALIKHLNCYYDFRRNIITEKIEYKLCTDQEWQLLSDAFIGTIIIAYKALKLNVSKDTLNNLFTSTFIKEYNPIKGYFDSLPAWDGQDYIKELAATVMTTDDATWHFYLEKWIVSMVRGAYFQDSVNQLMLVFYGKQGVGKTRWFMKFLPKELKELFFSGYTKLEDQMFQAKPARYLIIFLDEIDTYSGRMQAVIKSVLTQEVVKIRPLFSSFDKEFRRIASFAAAINHEKFLNDSSGSRRYLVVEVLKIDHNHSVSMDKVLTQAFALAKDRDYRHYLNGAEITQLELRNEQFKVKSDTEILIIQYYEPCREDDPDARYISATQILNNIQEKSNMKLRCSVNYLGSVLRNLGFIKGHLGRGNEKRAVWLVKERDNFS